MTISSACNAIWSSYETETLTLRTYNTSAGTSSNDTTVTGFPRVTIKPIDLSIADASKMKTWHLKAETCTNVPRNGDRLIQGDADSTAWIIQAIRIESRATRYRCDCNSVVI